LLLYDLGIVSSFEVILSYDAYIDRNLFHVFTKLVSRVLDGVIKSSGTLEKAKIITKTILMSGCRAISAYKDSKKMETDKLGIDCKESESTGEENEVENADSTAPVHLITNTLQLLRGIVSIGGRPIKILLANDAFLIYVKLFQTLGHYSTNMRANIFQETGLVAEFNSSIALYLAKT
jgi:hypothetical protein